MSWVLKTGRLRAVNCHGQVAMKKSILDVQLMNRLAARKCQGQNCVSCRWFDCWVCRAITEDNVLQLVLSQGEEELLPPSGLVAGGNVEDDGNETSDALHSHYLGVQIEDNGGLVKEEGAVQIAIAVGRGLGQWRWSGCCPRPWRRQWPCG